MPHLCTLPAQEPATIPTAGVENMSAGERAARKGDARDPAQDQRYNLAGKQRLALDVVAAPEVRPPGTDDRDIHHPAGPAGSLRAYGMDEWNQANKGTHGEITQGSSSPQGDQLPFEQHGNTWRAAPQPWDAAQYVGFRTEGA